MTIKYFAITIIVTILLTLAQVFVKLGLNKLGGFNIQLRTFFTDIITLITSYYLWIAAITIIISSLLWMKVLAKVELSVAYPLISISYVFGLLAARFIFGEAIPLVRGIGVIVIIIGVILIVRS